MMEAQTPLNAEFAAEEKCCSLDFCVEDWCCSTDRKDYWLIEPVPGGPRLHQQPRDEPARTDFRNTLFQVFTLFEKISLKSSVICATTIADLFGIPWKKMFGKQTYHIQRKHILDVCIDYGAGSIERLVDVKQRVATILRACTQLAVGSKVTDKKGNALTLKVGVDDLTPASLLQTLKLAPDIRADWEKVGRESANQNEFLCFVMRKLVATYVNDSPGKDLHEAPMNQIVELVRQF